MRRPAAVASTSRSSSAQVSSSCGPPGVGRCAAPTRSPGGSAAARTRSARLARSPGPASPCRRARTQPQSGTGPTLCGHGDSRARPRTPLAAGRAVRRRGRGRGRPAGAAGPARRRVLRRRQHGHAGRVDLPPRPRPLRPRLLHRPRHRPVRLGAGQVPGRRARGHGHRARGPRDRAVLRRGTHRRRADRDRRGGLRRGDGRQGVAGHPGAGPDAPRRRPAGLAGHRRPRSRWPR